jgi:outer membrane protein assembly factor BamB
LTPDNVNGLQVQWTFPTRSAIAGTPAVVNSVTYVADSTSTVYAVNRDGTERWQHIVDVPSPPAVTAGLTLPPDAPVLRWLAAADGADAALIALLRGKHKAGDPANGGPTDTGEVAAGWARGAGPAG